MPLRWRLALWYGALTGMVVVLVSGLTYGVHSRAQYDDLDRILSSAAGHVAEEYALVRGTHRVAEVVAVPPAPDIVVRIRDGEGHVLAASPNVAQAPMGDPISRINEPSRAPFDAVIGLFPALVAPGAPRGGRFDVLLAEDGTRWRILVLPVARFSESLAVMAPLARVDASIARFRLMVPLLSLLGAGVTLAAGWLLASRALYPVATLTEAARTIAGSKSLTHRVPIATDGDELGQLAVTFNTMLDSLADAHRSQERFVADASHELRAPLTAIQANLDLLNRHPGMTPEHQAEAIREASREADRLARLVADLLVLARADAGIPVRREIVELDRTVLEVVKEARGLARGQLLAVPEVVPTTVMGDRDRLKQLLLVLLDNAIKYTPTGGQVAVTLRRIGGAAQVVVRDSGVGIPAEDLPRVFERFYRADPARSRDPGGTGLGLSIAKWIAQQHGGDLTLASAPQEGTTATLWLPVAAETPQASFRGISAPPQETA